MRCCATLFALFSCFDDIYHHFHCSFWGQGLKAERAGRCHTMLVWRLALYLWCGNTTSRKAEHLFLFLLLRWMMDLSVPWVDQIARTNTFILLSNSLCILITEDDHLVFTFSVICKVKWFSLTQHTKCKMNSTLQGTPRKTTAKVCLINNTSRAHLTQMTPHNITTLIC